MMNIYAQTFMTASHRGCVEVQDVQPTPHEKRLNWFSRRKTRCIDLNRL